MRAEVGLLGAFLVLAYCFVWAVQPRYGPDEPRHFAYTKRLVEKHALPVRTAETEEDGAHTLHPPLYYALTAPVYLAARSDDDRVTIRAIKCFSPLLLLAALLCFRATLRRLFPRRPTTAFQALVLVALLPEFQLEAAVMNNDGLAVLLGGVWVWYLVRVHHQPPSLRDASLAGLLLAAFINTKATGWTLAPLWLLAVLARWWAHREWGPRLLRDTCVAYLIPLAATGWYARNLQLYGSLVPLDFGPMGILRPRHLVTGVPLEPWEVYSTGYVVHYGARAAIGLFESFWSQVDWIREDFRAPIYFALTIFVLGAATGLAIEARGRLHWPLGRGKGRDSEDEAASPAPPVWIPGAAFAMNWLHTWYIATFMHQGFYQGGRYLMPSVFGAGVLLAFGLERLFPGRRLPAWVPVLTAGSLLTLNVLCLIELTTVLNPRYVTP